MCNINLFMRRKTKTEIYDIAFLQTVTLNSYNHNDDGEGYVSFDSDGIPKIDSYKSVKKLAIIKKPERYLNKNWVAFHERFKTHGTVTVDNVQPIETENVFLLHNGIMTVTNKSDKVDENVNDSDSVLFAKRLSKRMKDGDTLPNSFKALLKKIDGSKSILMFCKTTNKLYYYKNDGTSFYVAKNKEIAFFSTNKENVEVASLYYYGMKESEIKSNVLYEINLKGDFKKVCKIKDDKYSKPFKTSWLNADYSQQNKTYIDTINAYKEYYKDDDDGFKLSRDSDGNVIKEPVSAENKTAEDYFKGYF